MIKSRFQKVHITETMQNARSIADWNENPSTGTEITSS